MIKRRVNATLIFLLLAAFMVFKWAPSHAHLNAHSVFGHGMSEAEKLSIIDGGNLRYMWLGATHMLSGYDHLLFVFGIVFFLTNFKYVLYPGWQLHCHQFHRQISHDGGRCVAPTVFYRIQRSDI